MTWLKQALSDNETGRASSTRLVSVMAGTTLSFATVLLTIGAFWRTEFVSVLPVFGTALAGLAAGNYMTANWPTRGKTNE